MISTKSRNPFTEDKGERLTVGEFNFEVQRSSRRSTIEIIVERDGALRLLSPVNAEWNVLESTVRRRVEWIALRQRAAIKASTSLRPPRNYEVGECFYFLGRPCHLLIERGKQCSGRRHESLRLEGDRFLLQHDAKDKAQALFSRWYIEQGNEWLASRIDIWARRAGVEVLKWQLRDLGFRWASARRVSSPLNQTQKFDVTGNVYFHWKIMVLPPAAIEYLIAHEIVHLHIPNHSAEFWKRLAALVPNYKEHQHWLLNQGADLL